MRHVVVATALAFVALAHPVRADEGSPDLYNLMTTTVLAKCRAVMSVALTRMAQGDSPEEALNNGNGSDGDGDWPTCLANGKQEGISIYQSTLKHLKKVKAREALKAYQAAWLAGMDGVPPASGEIRLDYRRRQSATDTKIREAWSKVQVEL
ncbi:MAG: hypothetical protein AB3X44_12350 [Leptothrix sp. (in: b-proteobacteria)]